jgi:PAT family beta-lactamase induction signal transducer AmpG
MKKWLTNYLHPKLLVIGFLGFSSGLPLLLVGGTLGAWLLDAGLDKATIGAFALVGLPYNLKFLWSPFIDRLPLPGLTRLLGRRRSWMIFTQILLVAAIGAFALLDPAVHPAWVAWLAVAVAFISASQDVVIDAYRAEYLDPPQFGEGAAMSVFGYRIGMLVAGAGALALADQATWQIVYIVMAAFMVVGIITVLCTKEPAISENEKSRIAAKGMKAWIYHAVVMPFKDFIQRYPQWILILLFILFYRLPDGFIAFITTPFFLDIGYTKSQVAAIGKIYGFAATILGGFAGGALIRYWGVSKSLIYFLLFHIITLLTYAVLAVVTPMYGADSLMGIGGLTTAITLDHLTGGMVTAAGIAYMMSLCNIQYTATQYALLSSLAAVASKTLAGTAGIVAESIGWDGMFLLSALMGLPAALIWVALRAKGALNFENKEKNQSA